MKLSLILRQSANSYWSINSLLTKKPVNTDIVVQGWVKSRFKMKKFNFLKVSDGSTINKLQVVVPRAVMNGDPGYHSAVSIRGKLVESAGAQQEVELHADELQIFSKKAPEKFGLTDKTDLSNETFRQLPHLRSRTMSFASLLRVRSQAKRNIMRHLNKENFCLVDTPILTKNDCEGGGEMFRVEARPHNFPYEDEPLETAYHKSLVFLTVSGQLHLEQCMSEANKVYTFNPAFRMSGDSRHHLHEFYMVELEEKLPTNHEHAHMLLLDRTEHFLKSIILDTLDSSMPDLQYLWTHNQVKDMEAKLLSFDKCDPFVQMPFREAIEILKKHNIEHPENDLNRASEYFLAKHCGNRPVFVIEWPSSSKAFYMTRKDDNPDQVLCFDLLAPDIGELIGGSLREYRKEPLLARMYEHNLFPDLRWYYQAKTEVNRQTGGFGMGFERFLQFITGTPNIRDTIPFPRAEFDCSI